MFNYLMESMPIILPFLTYTTTAFFTLNITYTPVYKGIIPYQPVTLF